MYLINRRLVLWYNMSFKKSKLVRHWLLLDDFPMWLSICGTINLQQTFKKQDTHCFVIKSLY